MEVEAIYFRLLFPYTIQYLLKNKFLNSFLNKIQVLGRNMTNGELSTSAVHRLIEKAGASRVGDDAVEALRKILEELALRIGKEAWELATHAGRKTVKSEDILLAARRIIRE